MSASKKSVVLVQTIVPDYRSAFFHILEQDLGDSLTVLCGLEYFSKGMNTGVASPRIFPTAKNIFLLRRQFLLQWGVQRQALRADIAVLEYNPRILNTWGVLVMRRILGRRTLLWGHVYSRRGDDNWLRRFQRGLASGVIVYTEAQKRILRNELGYSGETYAAPNALYTRDQLEAVSDDASRQCFLFVGRLVKEKKPLLMISAFAAAIPQLPQNANLLIVGDGPERPDMEKLIAELNISDRVQMLGHVSAYDALRALYRRSLAAVSPGSVGLSITQCLGFGVPMLYSLDEPHGPEIVAAKEGWNSLAFQSDNCQDLLKKMIQVVHDRLAWCQRAPEIAQDCRNRFSAETMAQAFARAIRGIV